MLIPLAVVLWVWLSPLAFVPVPWPDDAAFYFAARELFRWPPRWVMLPQAPFEPTYAIWNFNTMPLYPILIGIGRWVGIDGSFALKLWPLAAWAVTGAILGSWLSRAGLPLLLALLVVLAFMLDPTLRWASVLVRPESLVGLCGASLVLGQTFGFPAKWRPRRLWDPSAFLLAIGAYAHFNAIHLVLPVTLAVVARRPSTEWLRELSRIAALTLLYLVPWLITLAIHPIIFWQQMRTQWERLAVGNDWLSSASKAVRSIIPRLGTPDPWPPVLEWAAAGIWLIILVALGAGVVGPLIRRVGGGRPNTGPTTVPSGAWVLSSAWLWDSKPEVWFLYYLHAAVWVFTGVLLVRLWSRHRRELALAVAGLTLAITGIFGFTAVRQASALSRGTSWRWASFHDYVDCVDQRLTRLEDELGHPRPFRVWCPTFPDITIELSRRHPDWELTRANDFPYRDHLALRHGHAVEAVVITEMLREEERDVSAPASERLGHESVWMTWKDYYLYRLYDDPTFKPANRYICQRGRWEAFLFLKR